MKIVWWELKELTLELKNNFSSGYSITFEKGDLILTGTPSNSRPVEPGLTVRVEVEGLGVLQNIIKEGKDTLLKGYGAEPKDSEHIRSVSLGSDNKKNI